MKKVFNLSRVAAIVFPFLCVPWGQTLLAQEAVVLNVNTAVICRDVVNREPLEANTNFPNTIGKLYCFSEIVGANNPSSITHVWYYGNAERFRISLPVNASRWRTYSSKTIQPHETGVWHVDILDAEGNKLEVLNFHVITE